jgi:glucose/mannose-6-phosphate isomerase
MGNMMTLDKIDFKKLDPKNMIDHIENFPNHCRAAFDISQSFTLPSYYIKAKKIVLMGMGGSGQSAEIVKQLLAESTDLIVECIHDYDLPAFVDKETLVIVCSHSGNTEESLSVFMDANDKEAKLLAITTGGKLKILADKFRVPSYVFSCECPPRASFAYQFVFLLSIFEKLGYWELSEEAFQHILKILDAGMNKFRSETNLFQNPAKILAEKLHGSIPVIYSSKMLTGVAKRFKSQFNENSKNFAFCEELPELNHASIEGLRFPKSNCFILMLESMSEKDRIILRENLTAEVLSKHKISFDRIKFVQANTRLSEILLFVMFGDFVSYYLALLNQVNPTTTETIDHLKERLI